MKRNNISIRSNGYNVSIAQHYDGDHLVCQEIGVPLHGGEWIIEPFHGDLSGLIDALTKVEKQLEENSNA